MASAAQHGDQFKRYDAWAKTQTPPAMCYLIALDGQSLGAPSGWVAEPSLPRLVRCWQDSSNPHVAWLASAAADIFEGWKTTRSGAGPAGNDLDAEAVPARIPAPEPDRTPRPPRLVHPSGRHTPRPAAGAHQEYARKAPGWPGAPAPPAVMMPESGGDVVNRPCLRRYAAAACSRRSCWSSLAPATSAPVSS
jgi:hypothetical protein